MRPFPRFIAAFLMITAFSARAAGSEIIVAPSLTVGEEYNDNVHLDPADEIHDYITHITPSLHAEYASPIWDWKATYTYDYRYYKHHSYDDDSAQQLILRSTTRIVPDLLFLDVRDDYGRTSISAVRNWAQESNVVNLTEYNAMDVNPYITLRLTSRMTMTAGYQYRYVWYRDPVAIDRIVQTVYGDLGRELGPRTSLAASVRQDRIDSTVEDRVRTGFLIGPRYEYREKSFVWFRLGAETLLADGTGRETYPIWDAGVTHTMNALTLSYETGRTWVEDPYLIERREDRYVAGLRASGQRTSGGVSVARRDYSEGRYVNERRYSFAADFRHYLTERLEGSYSFSIDRYTQYSATAADQLTVVYLTDVRFDHHASDSLTVSLDYRYSDSYSPDVPSQNYDVNRVLIEVKKTF